MPTSPPFPLMHIEFSRCTNTRVCFLCGFSESSEQRDPFFAVQGCTNDPLFYFDRTSAWQHRGGYLRFQRAKILKVSSQAELRSDSDLTQLSVFSLKPYPSANLHLIVVAYFGGPCYFVVTGDAAAFTWPQYNFFWRTYQNESRRGKWIYQWFLIFSSPVRFTSWIMLNVGRPSLTPWNFKRSLSTPEFSLTCPHRVSKYWKDNLHKVC